jgi:hypothetical protein
MPEWLPLLKKIQEAGKGLVLDVPPQDVEILFRELDWRGLCVRTWCGSKEEGERLLDMVERKLV